MTDRKDFEEFLNKEVCSMSSTDKDTIKTYIITWDTKESGHQIPHAKTLDAVSAKAARKAFDLYYDSLIAHSVLSHYPHPFHIRVTLEK